MGRAMQLEIGKVFAIDYYAIPLDEFDVVLGIQWLATLGPILWDFSKNTMAFWRATRMVSWQGLGVPT